MGLVTWTFCRPILNFSSALLLLHRSCPPTLSLLSFLPYLLLSLCVLVFVWPVRAFFLYLLSVCSEYGYTYVNFFVVNLGIFVFFVNYNTALRSQ